MYRKLSNFTRTMLAFAILFGGGAMIDPNLAAAASKKFVAFATCPSTGKTGKVTRGTRKAAKSDAIKLCLANGGLKGCCHVKWVRKAKN